MHLDVLIPAFEYPDGIKTILDSAEHAPASVRIIISDDSKSDAVEECVRGHSSFSRLLYRRNAPSLGAVANWNKLLSEANGDYLLLLHHDEWPLESNFFDLLLAEINKSPDVLVLNVLLPGARLGTFRSHVPQWLRKAVVKRWPDYLMRRNVIGAPSALVIRRSIALTFDARLRWLVDVDWYVRLLGRRDLHIVVAERPSLISLPHQQSITQSLGKALRELKRRESKLLVADRPSSWALRLNAPKGLGERLLGVLESCAWTVVRGSTVAWTSWVGVCRHDAPKRNLSD